MLFSEENKFIYKLYSDLLVENPDTISIGDDYYSYDNRSMGNITGVMTEDGKFVMTKSLHGHYYLLDAIRGQTLEEVHDIIHNFSSLKEIYKNHHRWEKFRLWPKFKVFSFWFSIFQPKFKPAVDEVLKAIGDSHHAYRFDLNKYDDNFVSYDELMTEELSDEQKAEIAEGERRKAEDERRLADAMLGNKPKRRSIDLDIMPERTPAWKRRDGD